MTQLAHDILNPPDQPTPGPWAVETHKTKYPDLFTHSIIAERGWREADGTFRRCGIVSGLDSLPDARLIAAAPELLAALKTALFCMESPTIAGYIPRELEQARAAIAKATGGAT